MSLHHRHFTSQFSSSSSYYAPVRPQRRRELKLLPLPDYSPTSCYHSGHLRLVSPAVPYERALSALVGRHSYPTSSHGGRDDNAIVETKESRRRPRKGKKTAPNQGVRAPSSSELSTRTAQSGDPLGRKELGQHVVHWLKQGMRQMASEFASSDQPETQGNKAFLWSDGGHAAHAGFVAQAQAHLSATPMPKGQDALCRTASAHYPTLFDNFQRELRDVLLRRQQEGLLVDDDWRSTRSWALLKEMARSAEHRTAARRSTAPVLHTTLGVSLEKTRLMQARINGFVQQMTGLLRLERDAELELTRTTQDHEVSAAGSVMDGMPKRPVVAHGQAQEDGDTICNLRVIRSSSGLTGQHLVLFRAEGSHRLPATRLSPGDMVCVRACDSQGELAASTPCLQASVHNLGEDGRSITVAFRSRSSIQAVSAFSKFPGNFARIDRIQALADAVTYERNCEALMALQKRGLQKRNASIGVVATLFGDKEDATKPDRRGPEAPDDGSLETHSHSFDTSQSRALALALDKERPVLVIQGPPGTGKTRLLSYLVARVVRRGERVLVTAPSNAAVDNMAESLSASGLKNIVRVGNPSRISPSVAPMSLGHIVATRLENLTREFETRRSALRKDLKRRVQDGGDGSSVRQQLKRLGKDYRKEKKEAVREVLANAEVVLSTNTGAADPLVRGTGGCFDLVIIDEAGQAIEPSCWIPMLQGKRCILAGDHRQLAPVVLSREAMEGGLGMSLLERASSLHDGLLATTLTTQYRMHESIASWASKEMYDGLLRSFPSVASRLLVDYPSVKVTWMTQCALLLLDTRRVYGSLNIDCEESLDPTGTGSFYNNGEADIVAHHVLNLVQCGVPPTSIVVQSPYIAQVQLLQGRLQEYPMAFDVEVSTIDSFQGREADAVVISMVRSNSMGEVGFLADRRRMNVAITRAKSHVAVVCDTSTICNNAFLARLLLHIRQHGQVRHVDPSSLDGGFHLQALPSLG